MQDVADVDELGVPFTEKRVSTRSAYARDTHMHFPCGHPCDMCAT